MSYQDKMEIAVKVFGYSLVGLSAIGVGYAASRLPLAWALGLFVISLPVVAVTAVVIMSWLRDVAGIE